MPDDTTIPFGSKEHLHRLRDVLAAATAAPQTSLQEAAKKIYFEGLGIGQRMERGDATLEDLATSLNAASAALDGALARPEPEPEPEPDDRIDIAQMCPRTLLTLADELDSQAKVAIDFSICTPDESDEWLAARLRKLATRYRRRAKVARGGWQAVLDHRAEAASRPEEPPAAASTSGSPTTPEAEES